MCHENPEKNDGVSFNWLVVSTPLKNISQNVNLPQIGVKIKKHLKPPPRKDMDDFFCAQNKVIGQQVGIVPLGWYPGPTCSRSNSYPLFLRCMWA